MTDHPDPLTLAWRVGRESARTVFAVVAERREHDWLFAPEPSDADVLIGVMTTPELARWAVERHNLVLSAVRRMEAGA